MLPPLDNYPIPYYPKINILLTYISDLPLSKEKSENYWQQTMQNIQKVSLYGQKIGLQFTSVSLEDCPLCLTALKNSIKSRTSTTAATELRPHIHQYIDSKDLTTWLSKFADEFWGLKSFDGNDKNSKDDKSLTRTIPVYIYNLQRLKKLER